MSYGYKKGYNPQKYAENRKAEKERTYQMIDDTAIEVSRSPDKLKEFLAVQAKFDMYSAANTLLIFKQMPNATQLKSFEDWNKDGIQVRQKQKSIAILSNIQRATAHRVLAIMSKECLTVRKQIQKERQFKRPKI